MPLPTVSAAKSLRSVGFQHVFFDPTNPEHLKAYNDLQTVGRQHQTLRFHVEAPYLDVRSMMLGKIADKYMESMGMGSNPQQLPM